jgi:hypothetical protein
MFKKTSLSDLKRTLKGLECATRISKKEDQAVFAVVVIGLIPFPTTANRGKAFIHGAEGRNAREMRVGR